MFYCSYSSAGRSIVQCSGQKFWSCITLGLTCLGRRQIRKQVSGRTTHVRLVSSKKLNLVPDFKFKKTPGDDQRKGKSHEKFPDWETTVQSDDLMLTELSPLPLRRLKTPAVITREDPRIEPSKSYRRQARVIAPEKIRGEILYGVHPVSVALGQRRREIHRLYLKRPEKNRDGCHRVGLESLAADVPVEYIDTWTLDRLATGHVHQGVCMDVGPLDIPLADRECHENQIGPESKFKFPLCVVMEHVKDPMNFGAVLRSAYYFGVDRVFCGRRNSCKLSPVVSKASSGAMEVMDLYAIDNVQQFLQERKQNGWCIVGTSSDEAERVPLLDVVSFRIDGPVILILGNEGAGISRGVLSVCDVLLAINPATHLDPGVNSLNVSAAAAILLHALMTKRPRNA